MLKKGVHQNIVNLYKDFRFGLELYQLCINFQNYQPPNHRYEVTDTPEIFDKAV